MRALRIALPFLAILSLLGGTMVSAVVATGDVDHEIRPVTGMLTVHQLPGGTFETEDRIFQYRDYPVAGSAHAIDDSRLNGYLLSEWNWDVQSSGGRPVPAWGTITIDGDDGDWTGTFSGIRPGDFQPIDMQAVLFGEGDHAGLCATLNITALELAGSDTWVIDGIVHPVDMDG